MTRELRYPDLCREHAEQTLEAQAPLHGASVSCWRRGQEMAMEVLVWDWDGYAMNRNNYRIYHDPSNDKMVFLSHGMDQMFWEANGPIRPHFAGLVANAVIQVPEGGRRYRRRLAELFQDVYRLEVLTNRVDQLHARNRPAVLESGPDAVKDYDNAVAQVRDRIVQRWIGVKNQLDADRAALKFSDEFR